MMKTIDRARWVLAGALAGWTSSLPATAQTSTNSSPSPVLAYSTFLGSGAGDYYAGGGGYAVALGPGGTVFVLGSTTADAFPFTSRLGVAGQTAGSSVVKFNSVSRTIVYAAFIGGCQGRGIAVDGAGNAYVTGWTYGFAATNAFQPAFGGGEYDAFVFKLSAAGDRLMYGTYLGGSDVDIGYRIAVNTNGEAIIAGTTASADFPTTSGAAQASLSGDWNVFLAKLDASGARLVYGTYLGGEGEEFGLGLAVDAAGDVYVSGSSTSTNFPAMPHPFRLGTAGLGGTNAFVAKLTPQANAVAWLTVLGGSGRQYAAALSVDAGGNACVFGQTDATNFPVTANALQRSYGGGEWDNFVLKLNGSNLLYSSYLGGTSSEDQDEPLTIYSHGWDWFAPMGGIAVDPAGNLYVAGRTGSPDIAPAAKAANRFVNTYWNGYLAKIEPAGSALAYLEYLGDASYSCTAAAVAVDGRGNLFVSGRAGFAWQPPYFPVTPGAYQTDFGDHSAPDIYLTQLSETAPASANDNFADRVVLSGKQLTVQANNSAATKEVGEPAHAGNAGGRSLWWSWTAASSGALDLSTINSSFNTLLAVYTGGALGTLQVMASNAASPSVLRFPVVAGTTYQIAVDGKEGASGSVSLTLEFSGPPNDDFAHRTMITGFPLRVSGSNVDATTEPGDLDQSGYSGRSVWWSWTSPITQLVAIRTVGSTFDTVLAVYTGSSLDNLNLVVWDDDATNGVKTSLVPLQAQAGNTYQIQVSGALAASGTIQLSLGPSQAPANDNFADRTVLTSASLRLTNVNWGATTEANEPDLGFPYPAGNTIWWSWTAPTNGWVAIDTDGSDFDTRLGVFTGSSLTNLTRIAASAGQRFLDSYYNLSQVQFGVISHTAYSIVVDGPFGAPGGTVVLNLNLYYRPKILSLPVAWSPGTPFNFQVIGVPGQAYRVQTTTNLTNWSAIPSAHFVGSVSVYGFSDTNTAGSTQRFYRVLEEP